MSALERFVAYQAENVGHADEDARLEWECLIAEMRDEDAKLRELMARMAEALGIDCEWADPNWCKSPCRLEFGCWPEDMAIRCPAWEAMRELGVEP